MTLLFHYKGKGHSLEIVLKKCKYIKKEDGVFTLLERDKKKILEDLDKFFKKGTRED